MVSRNDEHAVWRTQVPQRFNVQASHFKAAVDQVAGDKDQAGTQLVGSVDNFACPLLEKRLMCRSVR